MEPNRSPQPDPGACSICHKTNLDTAIIIHNTNVCTTCLRHKFEAAINSEANYPPKIGGRILDAYAFSSILGNGLVIRYQKKARERETPRSGRIYCKHFSRLYRKECGTFAGSWAEACSQGYQNFLMCEKCGCYTCSLCFKPFSARDISKHRAAKECGDDGEADTVSVDRDAADLLKEGKWQRRRAKVGDGFSEWFWNLRYNM